MVTSWWSPAQPPRDLRDWLWTRPLQTPASLAVPMPMAWIALRPITRTSHPVAAPSKGCACEEPDYKPSRIRDWYRIVVLWTLPQFPPLRGDICSGKTECPPCPDTCDLVLAGIRLPKANDPLTDNAIDNWTWRKLLFSLNPPQEIPMPPASIDDIRVCPALMEFSRTSADQCFLRVSPQS